MTTSVLLWRFGAACAGSVVLALVLRCLLALAVRRWPALAAHRSTWLLAQGAVGLAFVLAMAAAHPLSSPLTRQLRWQLQPQSAPQLTPQSPLPLRHPAPAPRTGIATARAVTIDEPGHAAAIPSATGTATHATASAPAPLRAVAAAMLGWLPAVWLVIYLAGFAWHGARRIVIHRRWHALVVRPATLLAPDDLHGWPTITPAQRERIADARLEVRTTSLPVSPLLLGGRRPCLLLPAHLATLARDQQHLIVEHELTHWERADPRWLTLAAGGALLFWFNRPFARLVDGLRDAVELGCDDAVLAGRTARERQGYAAALVAQLRLGREAACSSACSSACAAPAFGHAGITARILRMRTPQPARLSLRGRVACVAAALGLASTAAVLQPAFSNTASSAGAVTDAPAPVAAAAVTAAAMEPWRYPIARPRVTSLYGVQSSLLPAGHHGVDFAARRGTPVLAAARGTVVEAAMNPVWGHYVRIDHGGGRSSLAIHLDRADVAAGQHVAAGDVIGAAGSSGRATGPHLHFEYWQDGRRRDPGLMLADLPAHATARALARRRAQGDPVPTRD
jgi:beta-lactamase regulating signal transducer with metallopeptidase domain